MLREIFVPLIKFFSFFNIFQYITFRAAYACVTALIISFIFGPGLIKFLKNRKIGQQIRAEGPQTHYSKSGTPTMGGFLIILSIVVSVLLWQDLRNSYTWITLISIAGFGAIGFFDDYLKLTKKNSSGLMAFKKFAGQIGLSLIIVIFLYINGDKTTTDLYLPFCKFPVINLSWMYIPFGVLLLTASSNSVNLTDGLDGLAAGLLILVALTFAIISYVTGRVDYSGYLQIPYLPDSGELTILCLSIVGACIGFLWYNSHPAEIFMGDTGSLSLGGVIGVIALMLKKEILLFIVGGVFLLEMMSVILQVVYYKATHGKRIFLMAPLHHHFEKKGWSESKIVIRFWILGGLFAILSLSTLKIQ